jgi:hypothetical protein
MCDEFVKETIQRAPELYKTGLSLITFLALLSLLHNVLLLPPLPRFALQSSYSRSLPVNPHIAAKK